MVPHESIAIGKIDDCKSLTGDCKSVADLRTVNSCSQFRALDVACLAIACTSREVCHATKDSGDRRSAIFAPPGRGGLREALRF